MKLILGIGEPLVGKLLLFSALDMSFRTVKLRKDADCPICGSNPVITGLLENYQESAAPPALVEA